MHFVQPSGYNENVLENSSSIRRFGGGRVHLWMQHLAELEGSLPFPMAQGLKLQIFARKYHIFLLWEDFLDRRTVSDTVSTSNIFWCIRIYGSTKGQQAQSGVRSNL